MIKYHLIGLYFKVKLICRFIYQVYSFIDDDNKGKGKGKFIPPPPPPLPNKFNHLLKLGISEEAINHKLKMENSRINPLDLQNVKLKKTKTIIKTEQKDELLEELLKKIKIKIKNIIKYKLLYASFTVRAVKEKIEKRVNANHILKHHQNIHVALKVKEKINLVNANNLQKEKTKTF